MEAERNRVLAGECISRAQIDAAGEPTEADIRAALAALDAERAAMLAIARARRAKVPLALIGEILPGIEFPQTASALIAIADGDRRELLALLEQRRFPATKDGAELEALALYAAWHADAEPARLAPEVRRLSVRSLSAEGFALVATVAGALDDPNVAAATKHVAHFAKEYAKNVQADERALTAKLDDVIASLPAEVEQSRAGGFTVRGAKQIGRNDPCPCGSGLKYKKCCADKPVAAPSPVPGLSWDEFLGSGAGKMTAEHVGELALRELARVELARVERAALAAIYRRFLAAHAWDHAERALAELERRGPDGDDGWRDELMSALLEARELDRARGQLARMTDHMREHALELAIADGRGWEPLVETATQALRSGDKIPDIELAYSLLRAAPPLGIYFARACIGTLHVDDPDMLLDAVEDARDRLGLPPTDPAWDVLDDLTEREKEAKADDSAALKTALAESSGRIDQLERMLAAMRSELDAARMQPAAALARAPEAERPSGLEARVRELEALIREGNAERRDLRQKLQKVEDKPVPDDHRARRAAPDTGDSDDSETEAVAPGTREIALPRFERRFADALADVPAAVASEAMRTIGGISAGDAHAWRHVKQAKDMTRPTYMARVGIHHRLIFRLEAGAMDVVDLITRETLLTTLKRLRAQR